MKCSNKRAGSGGLTSEPAPINPFPGRGCKAAARLAEFPCSWAHAQVHPWRRVWKAEETRAVLVFASPSHCEQPGMETPVVLGSAFPCPVTSLVGVEKQLRWTQRWHSISGLQIQGICPKSEVSRTSCLLALIAGSFSSPCEQVPVGPVLDLLLCTRSGKLCPPALIQPTACFCK